MIFFRLTLALAMGGAYVLGYAPFTFWFFAPFAVIIVLSCLHNQRAWNGFLIGWFFGIGLFGSGVTWIYNSFYVYGNIQMETATILTVLFCLFMALFYAAFGYFYCLFNYQRRSIFSKFNVPVALRIISFASLWTLFELLRSHIYVGFPWLLLGNALVDSPLAYWAPLGGTFLVSFLCLLTIASTFHLLLILPTIYVSRNQIRAAILLLIALFPWAIGFRLQYHNWTYPSGGPINLAVIQANIPQEIKWDDKELLGITETYHKLTRRETTKDLIVWPEAAIPYVYTKNSNYYSTIDFLSRQTNTTLIFGSLRAERKPSIYNSIFVAGAGTNRIQPVYDKRTLVPFGEYIPFQYYLERWLAFLKLSVFNITPGKNPLSFLAREWRIAPSICYEITKGQYIARLARNSHFLITLSNDSWFGDSLGPHQHMHLARMRALENQLYLIRSTNNGITALVAPNGKIASQLPQFQQRILSTSLYPRQGTTPYQVTGDIPVSLICLSFSLFSFLFYRRTRKTI